MRLLDVTALLPSRFDYQLLSWRAFFRRNTRMDPQLKYAGLVRALIYPIQFERDPCEGIDRVLRLIVEPQVMQATPMDFLAAIHEALASAEILSELIPQSHSEAVIRRYLAAIGDAIEQRWPANTT